ncbi:uncharacterized protein BX664DRAFT_330691 [Halteromyces radiatus]|uniref:uncharacterized protein n=1 Tax=Halteromyces radiatus TaxID=101107 RepID=UPI0022205DDC|nr:uncharacterized protein BX664DRAFT_330691 [Halteromyces radiatus]KAI8093833.1 hypothetical protein BX664DRAFT_330691 [Halteromyces radiatus]
MAKMTMIKRKNQLDRLPYDILIRILQLPEIDVQTVVIFAQALPYYKDLAMYVLHHHQLPRLYLQTTMDQEGKKQYLTLFHYHSLDVASLCVTFKVSSASTSKRYISNTASAARPRLRQLTLHHHHHHQEKEKKNKLVDPASQFWYHRRSCSSSVPTLSSDSSISVDSCSCCSTFSSSSSLIVKKQSSSQLLLSSLKTKNNQPNLIQSHSLSLKQGSHTIFLSSSSATHSKAKWQCSYHVDYTNDPSNLMPYFVDNCPPLKSPQRQFKTEHMYISPISITVPLTTLCPLPDSSSSPSFGSIWLKRCVQTTIKKFF